MTNDESSSFATAAKVVVETIEDNAENSSEVFGEADELERLGEVCGFDLGSQVTSLRNRAVVLAEREDESWRPELEEQRFASAHPDPEFDVDSLFAGLLESVNENARFPSFAFGIDVIDRCRLPGAENDSVG
jgi:hypothetical protein